MQPSTTDRWWLLLLQLPAKPDYLRVKIGRRLQRVGAVALRNAAYLLPLTDQAHEDFSWIRNEVRDARGDAVLLSATCVQGRTDADLEALFRTARDEDYAQLAEDIQQATEPTPADLARWERRFSDIQTLDFFDADGRLAVVALLAGVRERFEAGRIVAEVPSDWTGRTWVTRAGLGIDRLACAWLIRRFVDPDARFRFVAPVGHVAGLDEIRFDMPDGDITHVGDACSFEVLCRRLGLEVAGLRAIGEIVHDIDCKDGKFGRAEAPGVGLAVEGLRRREASDQGRLQRGLELFDDLLAALQASAA